jgi:hypothetical protein
LLLVVVVVVVVLLLASSFYSQEYIGVCVLFLKDNGIPSIEELLPFSEKGMICIFFCHFVFLDLFYLAADS